MLFGMTDGVENVLDENILVDIDELDDEPTNPRIHMPKAPEQHPMPIHRDAWF